MGTSAFALSLPQSSIYLDQLRHPGCPSYNVGGFLRLDGIDPGRLVAAHSALVREQEIFGLRIAVDRDGFHQHIIDKRSEVLPFHDLSASSDADAAAEIWIGHQFETPFEIEENELFRAWLLKLSSSLYLYVGMAHHLLMDGWGFANWARELALRYNGGAAALTLDWSKVVDADARYLNGARYDTDKAFWLQRLQQRPPRTFVGSRSRLQGRSDRHRIALDLHRVALIDECAARLGVGASHILLGLLAICLGLGAEHQEIVVGVPLHNRRSAEQKRMLGTFVNMVPLRIACADGDSAFSTLVENIAREQKICLRHQRYPSSHIVRDCGAIEGLFDIAFNYLSLEDVLPFGGKPAELVYVSHRHERRALMLTYWSVAGFDTSELQIDYSLAHFDDDDAKRLGARLVHLIDTLPAIEKSRLEQIDVLPDEERKLLLQGFASEDVEIDNGVCLHTLFERQVLVTPSAIAVSDGERRLSYNELNDAANRLAKSLISKGVRHETPVGIYLTRSVALPVAVLAVLKVGGSYVPLDPTYPITRIRALIEDSGLRLAVSDKILAPSLSEFDVDALFVDSVLADSSPALNPEVELVNQNSRAYVIYTSGSTGKPKGVEICHGNAVALLAWALHTYSKEDLARVLASTSLSFDLSVFELFSPLACGGEAVVVRDALELLDRTVDVTLVNTVPSAIRALIDKGRVPVGTKVVNLAGEPLPLSTVNDLIDKKMCQRVYNLYGPTEDTTYSTYVMFDHQIDQVPSIGRAISGSRAYVLDIHGRLAPFGAKGELYLAGRGVARGYLGSADLTSRKFVCNTFSGDREDRMYRTGDLVRYRGNGELEYLGRIDEQVKIRGFRIELNEIRQTLEQQPGVVGACVLHDQNSVTGSRLVAFVESNLERSSNAAVAVTLRHALQKELPHYMVPSAIVVLDKLPLTPNGKIDKARLLELEAPFAVDTFVAPLGKTEQQLADIWASVVGIDASQVSADANLFDLGGHSLLLLRLSNEIESAFDVNLSIRDLFAVQDLRGLALRIESERDAADTRNYVDAKLLTVEVLSEGTL